MAYINFSGYQTGASGWIEAILQDSDTIVCKPAGYLDTGVDYILWPTDTGVCSCSRVAATGATTKLGWLDQTDITAIATDETYLYVAFNSGPGDIGRIALADLLLDNADHTGDYTAAFGSANSMFDAAAARDAIDICATYIGAAWRLAYIFESENAANSTCEPYYITTGAVGGTYYRTAAERSIGSEHISLANDGTLFTTKGTSIAWKTSAHSIAANDWTWTSGGGNHDVDPSADTTNNAWDKYDEDNCAASSMGIAANKLTLSATVNSDALSGITHYGGVIEGDFDLIVTGCEGTDPAIANVDEYFTRKLAVYDDASNFAYASCKRRWDVGAARIETDMLGYCLDTINGATSDTDDLDATAPQTTWKMRIKRTTAHLLIYYDIGAGWVELVDHDPAGWSSHIYISLALECLNIDTETGTWDIYDVTNDDPQTLYSSYPAAKPITGMDAYKPSGALAPYLATCYDDDGAIVTTINTTTPNSSVINTYGTSGYDHDVLSSDNVVSVMVDHATEKAWFATSDAGIDVVSLTAYTLLGTADTTQGKTIDDQVSFIAYCGSAVYGTGTGAGVEGAGYLSNTFYDAPTDTEAVARAWMDTDTQNNILTATRKPADLDFAYSYLYRTINAGSEYYLKEDNTWVLAGTKFEFDGGGGEFEGMLCYDDMDVADGKYTYRWTHVNDGANESAGSSAVVYVDEPVIAVTLQGSEGRGAYFLVTGNSGGDSGSAAGEVYAVKVQQQGSSTYEYLNTSQMGSTWYARVYMEGAGGTKNIDFTPYDMAGQAGSTVTKSATYVAGTSSAPTSEENIMIGFDNYIDAMTLVANSADSSFPVTNIQDIRPNVTWHGDDIDGASGGATEYYYGIRFDAGAAVSFDMFVLVNHNLQSSLLGNHELWLCGHASDLGANGETWTTTATWKAELTNLTGRKVVAHRPENETGYQYWCVVLYCSSTTYAHTFQPYVGTLFFCKSTSIWQPLMNFNERYTIGHIDQSKIAKTEDQSIESNARQMKESHGFRWNDPLSETDWKGLEGVYVERKTTKPIIVFPNPGDIYTGDSPTIPAFNVTEPWPAIYGRFADRLTITGSPAGDGRAGFRLKIEPIMGEGPED